MGALKDRIRATLWHSTFLFVAFWAYIIAGGVIFRLLEHNTREQHVDEVNDKMETDRATLLNVLWAQTIATSEEDWLAVANERIDLYEKKLKEYLLEGIDLQDDQPTAGGDQDNPWTLLGSIFYCYTVVTTIGYGNLAPATAAGKILTMVYGTCGIPLTLILLGELGKLLTLVIKLVYSYKDSAYEDDDEDDEVIFTLTIALGLTFAFMVSGALFFGSMEGWSILDAAYFCFVTFSTIGFGDMVPEHQGYTLLTVLYSLIALSLMAMCMTVVQNMLDGTMSDYRERMEDWWEHRKQAIADAKAKKDREEAERSEDQKTKWKPKVPEIREEPPTPAAKPSSSLKHRFTKAEDEEEDVESEEIIEDDE